MEKASKKRNKLPIIFALIIGIGCLAFAFHFTSKTTIEAAEQGPSPIEQQNSDLLKAKLLSEKDSDSDGLQDWQEVLWNTDPYNPDTLGDGMSDGEKVAEGKNPGLSSQNSTSDQPATLKTTDNNIPLTNTELVARDIFTKYLALRDSNGEIDATTRDTLISNVVQSSAFQTDYNLYTTGSLAINQQDDNDTVRAYGNNLEQIVTKYSSTEPKSELEIVDTSIQTNDTEEIKKLDPIITGYTNILKAELSLRVPKSAADVHIQFINALSRVLSNIQDMRKMYDDPVLSLRGVTNYSDSASDLKSALEALGGYFTDKNIVFERNEAGYPLTQTE